MHRTTFGNNLNSAGTSKCITQMNCSNQIMKLGNQARQSSQISKTGNQTMKTGSKKLINAAEQRELIPAR